MNIKTVTAGFALALLSTAAVAADLPSRRAPPVFAPPPPPVFTWTGFYAGFNAGADFNNYTNYALFGANALGAANVAAGIRDPFLSTRSTGFIGGGQIGYNFQIDGGLFGSTFGALGSGLSPIFGTYGGIVAGVEADADGFLGGSTGIYNGPTQATIYRSRTDFVGTVRGRLGYAFGNLLLFGTGGFAYGGVSDNLNLLNPAGASTGFGGVNRIQTGYAYGGGVEYAIPTTSFVNFFKASAVTVKAEFIHYDLGTSTGLVASTTGAVYSVNVHNLGNLARIGVNYKFGSPAAPVVARY